VSLFERRIYVMSLRKSTAGDLSYQSVFGVNHKRLSELKAKYDPGFLFHKTSPIPPAKAA
jgi:hypothetical protein